MITTQNKNKIIKALENHNEVVLFTDREYQILHLRHVSGLTLDAVGRKFKLTRERIRQIEAKCLKIINNK